MKILVLGGAGYIGSHMAKVLSQAGYTPIIVDNLSTGFVELAKYGEFIQADITDANALESVFKQHEIGAVMHFAAASLVGESISDPAKYYQNNVAASLDLLDMMRRHRVERFVFSSTAAVYGEPQYTPIDEKHPKQPINPYGSSKWMVEQVLEDYARAYGVSSVRLRYFNAAGADPEGELGECHQPETHLIPLVLQAASGRRTKIKVYGRDYATTDGTCIRDYIHVVDLCFAHLKSLEFLFGQTTPCSHVFNLGIGHGYSVQQVIDVANSIVAHDHCAIEVEDAPRRAGDPAVLVANPKLAQEVLGWQPRLPALEDMIAHAWAWEKLRLHKGLV